MLCWSQAFKQQESVALAAMEELLAEEEQSQVKAAAKKSKKDRQKAKKQTKAPNAAPEPSQTHVDAAEQPDAAESDPTDASTDEHSAQQRMSASISAATPAPWGVNDKPEATDTASELAPTPTPLHPDSVRVAGMSKKGKAAEPDQELTSASQGKSPAACSLAHQQAAPNAGSLKQPSTVNRKPEAAAAASCLPADSSLNRHQLAARALQLQARTAFDKALEGPGAASSASPPPASDKAQQGGSLHSVQQDGSLHSLTPSSSASDQLQLDSAAMPGLDALLSCPLTKVRHKLFAMLKPLQSFQASAHVSGSLDSG